MNTENETEQEIIALIHKHKKINVKKNHIYRIIALTSFVTFCLMAFLYFGSSLFSIKPSTGPMGKISSPVAGSSTGHEVKITAETENLEHGQYVWLVVDKPDIGLCWPKVSKIMQNTKFMTTIYEGGPKEPYTLSLYAVTKTVNDQWQEWVDREMFGGLPMPPDKRRLDSVRLILKG